VPGDLDQDGAVANNDLYHLIDYLYLAGTAPGNPVDADVDNYLGITIGDVINLRAMLVLAVTGDSLHRECPPAYSSIPAIDSTVVVRFVSPIVPYSTSGEVPITLETSGDIYGFNLPIKLAIDGGVIPVIDSFVATPDFDNSEYDWEFTPGQVDRIDNVTATILIAGALRYDGSQPLMAGNHSLGKLYLTYAPSSAERNLNATWGTMMPVQPLPYGYTEVGLYPVMISGDFLLRAPNGMAAVELNEHYPILQALTSCCFDGYSGNTNCSVDAKRNLSDITRLIDFIYLSKADLCCEAEGNVDGDSDGRINLGDITRLIDHVYLSKGATAPCE
jgi:hypothetical protein